MSTSRNGSKREARFRSAISGMVKGRPSSSAWIHWSKASSGAITLHERDQLAKSTLRNLARCIRRRGVHRARERIIGVTHLEPPDDRRAIVLAQLREGPLVALEGLPAHDIFEGRRHA